MCEFSVIEAHTQTYIHTCMHACIGGLSPLGVLSSLVLGDHPDPRRHHTQRVGPHAGGASYAGFCVCVYAFMYVYVHCVVHGEHSRVDPGRLEAREGHLAHERRKHLRAVVHPVAAREQTQAAHAGAVSVSCTWDMRRPTPYPACKPAFNTAVLYCAYSDSLS